MRNLLYFCALLFTSIGANGLIIPEELPTILSLIYSNIPPIRKGTDSRLGLGFRLGQHADFQVLVELGPQIETEKIGNVESKRRREAMLDAAIRGDMGPWAKSVAEFNIAKLKQKQEAKEKNNFEGKKDISNNWLMKWSKEMPKSKRDEDSPNTAIIQKIRMPVNPSEK